MNLIKVFFKEFTAALKKKYNPARFFFDPFTIAFAILSIASAGISAISSISNARSAQTEANASASIERQNAANAELNARIARQQGEDSKLESARRFSAIEGRTRAQSGATGIGPGGSAEDILSDTVSQGLDEQFRIERATQQNIFAFRTQAEASKARAKNLRRAGSAAKRSGILGATGALLGGIAGAAGGISTAGGFSAVFGGAGSSSGFSSTAQSVSAPLSSGLA